ncbi:putative bifunctional diguanylate cyclase/phosphodiesterase [Halomonas sp. M20]|uniref:putative bifunctional diguanylate cyclase/phosphodiesterase n=1 Tax=Halomonas sp. M20 TaxID=2763264 RepID=UPI001D0B9968|nr:EAL domain-containing protein [Halomonas sp. M20]
MTDAYTGYAPTLVALTLLVAVMASLAGFCLAPRVHVSQGLSHRLWWAGGSLVMGLGIWSTHFIGSRATSVMADLPRDLLPTLISLLFGVLTSALALAIVRTRRLSVCKLALGGSVMGAGIALMHYVGISALDNSGPTSYDPLLFMLSIVIAVSGSMGALWLSFRLRPEEGKKITLWKTCSGALVMGMVISGMVYTAIAAVEFPQQGAALQIGSTVPDRLAFTIAFVAIGIMLIVLMLSIYDAHLASSNARLAASLRKANFELKALVSCDPLTRLPNRLLLEERLDTLLARGGSGPGKEFAVFFVDLDRFKTINDSLGHHIGDELIQQVASRLKVAVRNSDMLARVGGDEFMIVSAENTDRASSATIAKRIVSSLSKAFQIDGNLIRITTSVGISRYPVDGADKHALMIHADAAMYIAKDAGRNTFKFFEPGMNTITEKRARLESRLRDAIDNDALSLAYQPKVNVVTGEITGVEALLRWHDAELGHVTPDEVIPVAEETGLILQIGEWVLKTACQQSMDWHAQGYPLLKMAVNLSAIQLNNRNFMEVVRRVLSQTQLPAHYLELELTESAIMQNPDRASMILRRLRKLGIALSIDDFGTGYSNLSQLKRFPISCLKIDRSFTSGVNSDAQDAAIVKAVVALAHSLNLEVVAEGIETQEQLAFIREIKGQQYQGYLCSKALSSEEFQAFLRERFPVNA